MNNEQTTDPAHSLPKKKPLVKKVLFGLITVIVLIPVIAFVAAWLLEDKIKAKIIAEVNNEVNVPIQVGGAIDFSLLKHFPYASLSFEKVSIDDKLRKKKKLLNVNEFSFLFNVFSLWGSKIEVSKVLIKNGEINLYKDEAGHTNFDILKPSAPGAKSSLAIQLKKAEVKNVKFTYLDKTQQTDIDVKLVNAQLKGNFSDANFELTTKTKITVNRISVNGEQFMQNRNVSAELTLLIDKANKRYDFKGGKLTIDKTDFGITGFFASVKNYTKLDFKLQSSGKDIQQLFSLFPDKYKDALANADGTGEYSITANVKGNVGKGMFPAVNVTADLKNSEVKLGRFNKFLKNVNATATYNLDESGNDKLNISNFNCTLDNLPFNFKLTLTHLSNPTFDFYANGVLHLTELTSFIPDSVVQDVDGTITFNAFHLIGRKDDFTDVDNSTLKGSGEFKMNGVEFRQNGISYGNIGGVLKYEGDVIEAQGFTLNFLSTDFSFTGSIHNLFAFVYNLSQKRKSNEIILGVDGTVKTKVFNLSGIIDAYNKKNRPQAQVKQKIDIREILSMKGNLNIDIGRFIFREMNFEDLKGRLQIVPGQVRINEITTRTMGGNLQAHGDVRFTTDNSLNIECDVAAIDLDIPTIFKQCENFGQTTLTDRNLKGTVSTAISLNATWFNYKELDDKNLSAIVDFSIKNGELIKFEPLKAASKFIKVEELEDIKFSSLSNTIKIANRRIDVPEFEIKSTALNLIFFGSHTFDNIVDYHFKINLHKLLAQRFTRKQSDISYIENDPYEGLNLYLSMVGPLDNPSIKFDKASTRNKIKDDFKKEREEMKNLLKNNVQKPDESERKREDKYFDIKEEPSFIDFDEEQKKDN